MDHWPSLLWSDHQMELFERLFWADPSETFIVHAQVRSKYMPPESRAQIINESKQRGGAGIIRVIAQGQTIHRTMKKIDSQKKRFETDMSSLVVYASVNPRDVVHANRELCKHMIDNGFELNVCSKIKSLLHAHGQRRFVTIDLDTKDQGVLPALMEKLIKKIPKGPYAIIETRGGFHIIFHIEDVRASGGFLYQEIKPNWTCIDVISSDLSSPVPGTLQGGFPVRFIKQELWNTNADL